MCQELFPNKGANPQNVFFTAYALSRLRNQDMWQIRRVGVLLVTLNVLEERKGACTVAAPANRFEPHAPEAHFKRTLVPSELMRPSVECAVEDNCIDCCVLAGRARVVVGVQDPIEIRRRNPKPSTGSQRPVRSLEKRYGGIQSEVLQEVLRIDRVELFEGPDSSSVEYEVNRRKKLYICVDPPVQAMSSTAHVEANGSVLTLDRWHRFLVQREELSCSDQSTLSL